MPQPPASVEEAVELFLELRRRGEPVARAEFVARHARLGPELDEALESLEALAGLEQRARAEEEPPPERIGPFRSVREIGRGGMGIVLEAIEEPLGRRVALKLLPAHALASASARTRFRREAELAARLDHPGIATVYAAGVEGERPWIAMRYVEGATLAEAIAFERKALDPRAGSGGTSAAGSLRTPLAAARCLARVARALQAAHERGIVHRDVKPSNVIVAADGMPVLVDFGLAIQAEAEGEALTRTGETAGTPAYLAPELLNGECARHDAQSDVYALGVTLYECLALRRPFEGPTPAALYRAIVASSPTAVSRWNRAVPRDLAVVVATAIERDRARRYASAAKLAEDLEACAAQRPIAARALPLHGRLVRWVRREPRLAALAGMLLLALLGLGLAGSSWWRAHEKVLASERLARAQEVEELLAQGFYALDTSHAQAEGCFERALELEPGNVEARVGRVLSSVLEKRDEEAAARLAALPPDLSGRAALEALVRREAPSADASVPPAAGAIELFVRGQALATAAASLPYSQRTPLQRSALHFFTEAALRSRSARSVYQEMRAATAQQVGDEAAARSAAAVLQELWPDSPHALFAAGRALHAFEPREARALLERSYALRPERDTCNLLVNACLQQGALEDAEAWSRRGLARDPDSGALHFLLGMSMGNRECYAEARDAFLRAAACDPTIHAAWSQMATQDYIAGELDAAEALFVRALQLDPQNHRVRLFLGAVIDARGERERARTQLDHALAGLFPADAHTWAQFSAVFLQLRSPGAALRMAETGLALAPEDAWLRQLDEAARAQVR